jgi:hypothetical protein
MQVMSRGAKGIVLVVAVVAAAVFAASALAGSGPVCGVYCPKGTSVQKQVGGALASAQKSGTPTSTSGGQLPFTGLDLGFIALAGVVLVATGFGLHRASRKPSAPPEA